MCSLDDITQIESEETWPVLLWVRQLVFQASKPGSSPGRATN